MHSCRPIRLFPAVDRLRGGQEESDLREPRSGFGQDNLGIGGSDIAGREVGSDPRVRLALCAKEACRVSATRRTRRNEREQSELVATSPKRRGVGGFESTLAICGSGRAGVWAGDAPSRPKPPRIPRKLTVFPGRRSIRRIACKWASFRPQKIKPEDRGVGGSSPPLAIRLRQERRRSCSIWRPQPTWATRPLARRSSAH